MTKDEALDLALEALENNRRTHYYCEDTWYSCPKHEDGCANEAEGDECNCGADKANQEIDNAITAIKQVRSAPAQEPEGKQFQAKFNIEDRVWYMKNNRPVEVVISAIEIFFVDTNQDRVTYNAMDVDHSVSWLDHTKLHESWLFKSKTELLESL